MVGASGCVGGVLESVVRLVAVVEGCSRARGDGDPAVVPKQYPPDSYLKFALSAMKY